MLDATDATRDRHRFETVPMFPVEATGLTFADRGRTLVDGVSLRLERGPRTVVMGPNGAGKSLLLRMLHGIVQPSSGAVTWAGDVASEAVRAKQAMVFQRPTLLRRSVEANIRFVAQRLRRLRSARADGTNSVPIAPSASRSGARAALVRWRAATAGLGSRFGARSRDPVPGRALRQSRSRFHTGGRRADRDCACRRHQDRARHPRYRPSAAFGRRGDLPAPRPAHRAGPRGSNSSPLPPRPPRAPTSAASSLSDCKLTS